MRKKVIATMLCMCLLAGMTGCAGGENTGEDTPVFDTISDSSGVSVEDLADGDLPTETPPADVQVMETVNLMEGVERADVSVLDILPSIPITRFGVPLLQNAIKEAEAGENVLVSPLSAWTVLCMVEGGADGDTKTQMQNALGIAGGNHQSYLMGYTYKLPAGVGYQVNMANGIWYKNVPSLHVEDSFLQYNKSFFDATAYKAPFNKNTLQEINNWVSENTDGMIPSILDEIKEEDVMYLLNALSFDAEWKRIYNETEIWKDVFTTETGSERLVPMMHSEESVYLEDELATGFMKYYKGEKYAFVALLPKEGTSVANYVESLTAEGLSSLLNSPVYCPVETTMPKFSTEYSFELNEILQQMGMKDAFSEDAADFSKMATSDIGNIYISKVLQKTFIAVDEKGTKAGAATAVAMANKMALLDKKKVNLNRPFVYMIIECEYNEPLFIGTLMDVEQ